VCKALLQAAESGNVQDYVLEELGAMGGPEAAERLLNLVQGAREGEFWAKAARALATTGDARAVQHFNRARILEKDPGRRRLAEQLYEQAQAEHARREKAAQG